jgi:exonuclease SbcC
MQIKLLKLSLFNFKGIQFMDIDFKDITNIDGENGTGKTTVFDAFNWLLFGKDSKDRKDFNIKTLDGKNNPLHRLNHEVIGLLEVDGVHVELKRVYKENWVKKRGSAETEMAGHETEYYYNQVPLSQKEYNAKIDGIIKEELAKLLTNPLYFNSLKWEERRRVLENIAGPVTDAEVLSKITNATNAELVADLIRILASGKSLKEYQAELSAKKKKAKDVLETIPTRVDEASKSKPDPVDYAAIEVAIEAKQNSIKKIDALIQDKVKAMDEVFNTIQQKQNEINSLKTQITTAQQQQTQEKNDTIFQYKEGIKTIENLISGLNNDITRFKAEIASNNQLIESEKRGQDQLRKDWEQLNAKELAISEDETTCPACQRQYESDQVSSITNKLTENFNTDKARRLNDMNKRGIDMKDRITSLENRNNELDTKIQEATISIQSYNVQLNMKKTALETFITEPVQPVAAVVQLNQSILEIESTIPEKPTVDNTEYNNQKAAVQTEIDNLNKQLATRDQLNKINERIAQLEAEEKELAQIIANYEQTEFIAQAYTRAKIDEIERRVNSKFSLVKFKMFETQINGGEAPCCECLVNGVPYSDVNTAGKINAGVDILNVLMKHYGISTPVWIDNRESINNILPCNSQIINLTVSKNKVLTIQ